MLKGGSIIGLTKGDTRNLDYRAHMRISWVLLGSRGIDRVQGLGLWGTVYSIDPKQYLEVCCTSIV